MVYKAGLLISILFLHACNDNNNSLKTKSSVNPSIKEKPEPIIKKESEVLESDLIGALMTIPRQRAPAPSTQRPALV